MLKTLKSNLPFLVLAVFISFTAYFNSLSGEFVSADDEPGIVNNSSLTSDSILLHKNIQQTINSVIVKTFGIKPAPFHVLSLTLHLINIILVFALTKELISTRISAITTLLFALHPINTEAVTWISASGYLLRNIFLFSTAYLFTRYIKEKNIKFYIGSVSVYLLGLFTTKDPWILTTLPILGIIDYFFLSAKHPRMQINAVYKYLPFITSTFIFILIIIFPQYRNRVEVLSIDTQSVTPVINRAPYILFKTAELLIMPINLTIYHDNSQISYGDYQWMVAISLIWLLIVLRYWQKNRTVTGLLFGIPLTLLPSFSPVIIAWFIAERYLYTATWLFSIGVAMLLLKLNKSVFAAVLTIILILYWVRVVDRNRDFADNIALWEATQKTNPVSYRVYNNLGDAYLRAGDTQKAVASFQHAIEINPQYSDAIYNLGRLYVDLGQTEEARLLLNRSLEINPNLVPATELLEKIGR
ncbi:hypothetical protein A3K34_03315 [candidate division WWE3 bacterium RIFOXYC1_FULL_40_10]|uniref:Uncharacterized protein n=1 Tax=candidate division WWE3 bacterium RIFOXYA2_FULL_46_9 TaxID=1802636 RepID=A0A1F4VYK1_UNCKA|nr:MAG: hypothetical protein A3K58_03315 [candidate division WWE3 bacterium RIFOXYB1_FULL_40_22]OGC61877.1 MAG: hypothetical protein A3K37_03315 [candidate division WWE3 bacterium RIFOXYA1_FULL_40_11]OGC62244.1 MAG: hypothetical protein A2264_03075 [candidate division WWE3 bacterium RIFOXYA2_FULL_46_9]OGC64350.1 MAG: hypothetical protein A2326_00730 [candidate division WWE3 bacterium RIFOXYB2_FULL_41_6]OGC66260.1 MAG: hypothetical protein A3K34_03315 [candidate division WWE3 bacterium RIFOXYC1_